MKTVAEARYDVIEQIGTYAGCASMHDEPGKDAASRGITAALDQLEQAIRHDETAKLLALTGSDNSDDELGYINERSNCGANEPAEPPRLVTRYVVVYETKSGFLGEYMPRRDYSEAVDVASCEVQSSNGYKAGVVAVTREVVAEFERPGHA